MNPEEVTTVIMQFKLPSVPLAVPSSPRTGGNEYVWHCHILEHDEHDMIRPLGGSVEPIGWSHYGSNTTKQHMHNGQRRSEPKRLRARRTTEPDGGANSDDLGRLHANTSGINNVEICWMALGA